MFEFSSARSASDSVDSEELEVEESPSAPPDFYLVDFLPAGFDEKKKGQIPFWF
jgi:uncharacterized protein YfaS (alpha-2-macroglobulin family)